MGRLVGLDLSQVKTEEAEKQTTPVEESIEETIDEVVEEVEKTPKTKKVKKDD